MRPDHQKCLSNLKEEIQRGKECRICGKVSISSLSRVIGDERGKFETSKSASVSLVALVV